MSSTLLSSETRSESQYDPDSELSYRSVSRSAVFGIVLGILGLMCIFWPPMLALPLAGFFFAVASLASFRKYPDELSGKPLAVMGFILNLGLLVVAPARHMYIYSTEVPDGYERISFSDLKSPLGQPDVPTQTALDLNGKQVFLKGYIHPSSVSTNSSKYFVLVPDWATCCFGGQPPLTHMIEVTLTGDLAVRPSTRKLKLAGKLQVDSNLKPIAGLQGVFYQLRADHLE